MHALAIRSLWKTYPNGVEALKGIDLKVEEGDFFALLGPNGAGKTTAIGIVTSLVNKTSGDVKVFGHSIDSELEAAKACIGVVPQELNLNQWDKVFNCVTEAVLRELRLWDRRGETARNLSGGMKRRLMIARALVHGPKLLILDEPTAGVDIEIRRSMWDFLRTINRNGTTIILTTHYLEEAENLCRHVAIIDDGVIVEDDRMSAVLRKLHHEVFVLNLRQPVDVAPKLNGFDVERVNEHELEVQIHKDQDLNGLFSALSTAGVEVISMRNKTNRLEELFVRLIERRENERNREKVVEELNL
jgi:ABC-2 type transport system ATP-binding protein